MKPLDVPPLRDIVLLGGGHANVQVLKRFGMRPEPGVRLTIVAREPHSPYSGMLPGLVAGVYAWGDIHIDLARLAAFAGARFIAAEATGLDVERRHVTFEDRPPLRYDVLAVNTGGLPGEDFASSFVTPVKPIGRFLPVWRELVEDIDGPQHLTIVGARRRRCRTRIGHRSLHAFRVHRRRRGRRAAGRLPGDRPASRGPCHRRQRRRFAHGLRGDRR